MSMINNPPHIEDKEGQILPSALIPFCAFGSVLQGKVLTNISFPVCNLFDPVVYDGKLCYQVDLSKKIPKETTTQGKGLTLIIDANIEKSVRKLIEHEVKKDPKSLDLQEASAESKRLVGVNIGTLAPYQAFGPGNYILTSIKQMSATESFLAMSQEKRECKIERSEACQERMFQQGIQNCGCVPQSLVPALRDQSQEELTTVQCVASCLKVRFESDPMV